MLTISAVQDLEASVGDALNACACGHSASQKDVKSFEGVHDNAQAMPTLAVATGTVLT